jgi:hypothetical protein
LMSSYLPLTDIQTLLVDDMMDDEDEETETDAIVNQVLDEIGISLTQEVRARQSTLFSVTNIICSWWTPPIQPLRLSKQLLWPRSPHLLQKLRLTEIFKNDWKI